MNNRLELVSIILFTFLLSGCHSTTKVTDEQSEHWNLSIDVQKQVFQLGEPISVLIKLANEGKAGAHINGKLSPYFNYIRFYIKHQNSNEKLFQPILELEEIEPNILLASGGQIQHTAKIFLDSTGWVFAEPGEYQIRAIFDANSELILESKTLTLTVLEAKTVAEQQQAVLMMGFEQGLFLLWEGGDHLVDGIQALKTLTQEYPNSIHASYANYAIGMSYIKDFYNFNTVSLRPPYPKRAVNFLKTTLSNQIPIELRRKTTFAIYDAYVSLGNIELSRDVLLDYKAAIENLPQFEQDKFLLDGLIKPIE